MIRTILNELRLFRAAVERKLYREKDYLKRCELEDLVQDLSDAIDKAEIILKHEGEEEYILKSETSK